MDRKSIAILAVTAVLFFMWPRLVNRIYPPIPAPQATNSVAGGTNGVFAGAASTNTSPFGVPSLSATDTNSFRAAMTTLAGGKAENVTVDTELVRYHFTPIGGGIQTLELKEYKTFVGCKSDALLTNPPATLNTKAPLPMFMVTGAEGLLGDNIFQLSTQGQTVRAEKTLTNGLVLVKEFQILSNYQANVTLRWENRGAAPVRLPARELVIGTATPLGAFDDKTTLGLDWYDGSSPHRTPRSYFEASSFMWVWHTPAKTEYSGGASNVNWAAVHNQFFTAVITPALPAPRIIGHAVDLPMPTAADIGEDTRAVVKPGGVAGAFAYPEVLVPEGKSFTQEFHAYTGPKEYKTLVSMKQDVDLVMNMEGFWGWFAKMLLRAMIGLHSWGISYGWAIVLIVVILKAVFYPINASSTRSMKRMQTLQPQMKAIQDKYKDDKVKAQQKLHEFMKEHKINPLGSCLPLLITIPIFAGFYFMLRSAIELRGASFLWACDLSAPDTLFSIPLFITSALPFNGFAVIMVVTMMWQSHMTPPSPGIDPAQQKLMRYMPLIIVPVIYNQASGLTLYWSVQNLLSILQMKLTHDKPEKPSKTVVITPPARRKS
jgi:YidC/Oxa1 family membrane protein insertase